MPAYRDSPLRGRLLGRPNPKALAVRSQGMNQKYGLGRYADPAKPKPTGPTVIVQPGAGGAKPTPVQPNASVYSSTYDPILQQIKALSAQGRESARQSASALRKQLAISSGFTDVIPDLDADTMKAATDNPFSVRARLKRDYERSGKQLDENYNDSNLFYSGARANALGDQAFDYQNANYSALNDARSQASSIYQQLMQALLAADQADIDATWEANQRAQDQALQYGVDPGSGLASSDVPPPEGPVQSPNLQAGMTRQYTPLPGRGSQDLGAENPYLNIGNIGQIAAGQASTPAPSPIQQALLEEEQRRRRVEGLL